MENPFSIIVSKDIIELKEMSQVNQGISNRMLHPRYRTSHCYSELSGDYWDKLSHSTITHIFAGIHAQARASGKGIRQQKLYSFFRIVYCQFVQACIRSAYIYM